MSCCDSADLLPVSRAIEILLAQVKPIKEIEVLPLKQSLNRVAAEDLFSSVDVPAFDNSAMDGYAVHLDSIIEGESIPVSQKIIAGDSVDKPIKAGTCVRIFTGAALPKGCDAVIMQEECIVSYKNNQQYVVLPKKLKFKQNIRQKGQDIIKGGKVLSKGKKIRAQDIGLLASVGISSIPVYRKLKVALISTGNELVEPGYPINSGQIYNSNHYTLSGLLESLGCTIFDCGSIEDDVNLINDALIYAAKNADCVITSGGVSVGEEDHVKNSVAKLGHIDLWKVAIKPGKPFAFGHINDTPIIGLPGNPSAVFITFNILAKHYLCAMQGVLDYQPISYIVKADFDVTKLINREQYLYAKVYQAEGSVWVNKHSNQSSGVLSSSCWASGLVKISANTKVNKGDWLEFFSI